VDTPSGQPAQNNKKREDIQLRYGHDGQHAMRPSLQLNDYPYLLVGETLTLTFEPKSPITFPKVTAMYMKVSITLTSNCFTLPALVSGR